MDYRLAFSWSRVIESMARLNILHHIPGQVQRFRISGIILPFSWLIFRKEVCHEKRMAVLIAYACVRACSFSMLSGSGTGTSARTRAKTRTRAASSCPAAATAAIAVTTVIVITARPLFTSNGSESGFPPGSGRNRFTWRRTGCL